MPTIHAILSQKFFEAISRAFPELESSFIEPLVEVTVSTNEKFGHYQCNTAMKLSKALKRNPREVAEAIVLHFDDRFQNQSIASKIEIAGPGFINVTLNPEFISHKADSMLRDTALGIEKPKKTKRIVIDFSSPNTAKEMHVGHLRSTIIGDSLARLFEFLGYEVIRLNHVGDWGTAFGMLIAYMKKQAPHILEGKEKTDLTHLVSWYRLAKDRFDQDPEFKKASQLEVVALQSGNPESMKAWEIICNISRKAYQEIYDLLDVKLIERGESFYNPMLAKITEELEAKRLITISNGAKCLFVEGFKNREGELLPLMIQKSDGGYTYDTTDMAAIKQRIQKEKADRLIYVTDAGQATHFQMIFKAAEKAGYLDPAKVEVNHVPFGLVLGTDGKKFRTRSGETERLADLLQNAIEKAKEIIEERDIEISEDEKKQLAKTLGIGAVKYADLSCHRVGDYVFNYERMLKFEGNTAAFLLYAYVRVSGIKRKVKAEIDAVKLLDRIKLHHPSEIALGVHIAQFEEILIQVAHELLPNRLADYLYGLAEKFNVFFRDCRVEGSPEQNPRLLLCELTACVLKQGLKILGLETVERM